jgi:hypothetical protein
MARGQEGFVFRAAGPLGGRLYVRDPHAPEWGLGLVIADGGDAWDVFFESGRRRAVGKSHAMLARPTRAEDVPELLAAAAAVRPPSWARAHHSVYVVELEPAASADDEFSAANPDMIAGGPCFYVGLTGLSPEHRFENHRRGRKSARIVRRFGVRLLPALYRHHNPVPFEVGRVLEPWLAARLRERRFGVWQN